jgi:hypothetical protein
MCIHELNGVREDRKLNAHENHHMSCPDDAIYNRY